MMKRNCPVFISQSMIIHYDHISSIIFINHQSLPEMKKKKPEPDIFLLLVPKQAYERKKKNQVVFHGGHAPQNESLQWHCHCHWCCQFAEKSRINQAPVAKMEQFPKGTKVPKY